MTRVLIVDDHPMVLQGCRRVLQDAGVCDVLEASNATSGYRLFRRNRPDIVIVDLALKGNRLGGLDLVARMRLHDSRLPILVLSMHSDAFIVSRALQAGATGYVLKDAGPGDFLDAFESVRNGKPYLNHDTAVQVALHGARPAIGGLSGLSPRELQVLTLLAEGKAYRQIGHELNVSYKTVANLCSQLKGKLGVRNLPELIRMAVHYVSSTTDRPPPPELQLGDGGTG
ncbi:response regulator transcription factor [Chelativorans sp. M5D2P16]|uniref:response regulator transcription factor n=1 Tax=Chelativorans sp. M5D2P16 TaxID=3095678 RepID=UPI002ACA3811|nr:response regulator transcription factor [Chelativorans sp. M5D2P16]MDZ5695656.1 response regulator transcription factor [Chelativorans sp. M5D2P16]